MRVRQSRPALFGKGIPKKYDDLAQDVELSNSESPMDQDNDCSKAKVDSLLKEVEKVSIEIRHPALFGKSVVKPCDIIEQEDNHSHPDIVTEEDTLSISEEVLDSLLKEVMNMVREEKENIRVSTTENSLYQIDIDAAQFNIGVDAEVRSPCSEYECFEPVESEIRSLVEDLQRNVEKYTFMNCLAENDENSKISDSHNKLTDNINNSFKKSESNQKDIQTIEKKDAQTQFIVFETGERGMQTHYSTEDRSIQTDMLKSTTETGCQTDSSELIETAAQVEVQITPTTTQPNQHEICRPQVVNGLSTATQTKCMDMIRESNNKIISCILTSPYIEKRELSSDLRLYLHDGSVLVDPWKESSRQAIGACSTVLSPNPPIDNSHSSTSGTITPSLLSTPTNETSSNTRKRPASSDKSSSTPSKHNYFTRLSGKRKKD